MIFTLVSGWPVLIVQLHLYMWPVLASNQESPIMSKLSNLGPFRWWHGSFESSIYIGSYYSHAHLVEAYSKTRGVGRKVSRKNMKLSCNLQRSGVCVYVCWKEGWVQTICNLHHPMRKRRLLLWKNKFLYWYDLRFWRQT